MQTKRLFRHISGGAKHNIPEERMEIHHYAV